MAIFLAAGTLLGPNTARATGRSPAAALKAALGLSAARVTVGQSVTASVAKSTVPAGDKLTRISLSWGDGSKAVSLASLGKKAAHKYAQAGTYKVKLTLTDKHKKSVSASATERVILPPLGKARQLVPDGQGYCALFSSGRVYCWGYGESGELGAGAKFESATALAVAGLAGKGVLTGVASLGSDGQGVCAVLKAGGVDCWGYGGEGALGDGSLATADVPVPVKGVGGKGTLAGVARLASYSGFDGRDGYCALLTSGGVDCWGWGYYGQLGDGKFYTAGSEASDVPVAVKGIGGKGTLAHVTSLASVGSDGEASYCARLSSGAVACWGYGLVGQLGDGKFYTAGNDGSDVPVAVEGIGGTGNLTGVTSLSGGFMAFCAVLSSGRVDCWGYEASDQLGDGGAGAARDAAAPVAVLGAGGSGTLAGVSGLANDGDESYCAILTAAHVVCWGVDQGTDPATISGTCVSYVYPFKNKGRIERSK